MLIQLDGINLILNGLNLVMNATIWIILIKILRIKFKIEKEVGLVPSVNMVPDNQTVEIVPVPQPVELKPVPTIQQQFKSKVNPKAQKQINLLTAELERLKAL